VSALQAGITEHLVAFARPGWVWASQHMEVEEAANRPAGKEHWAWSQKTRLPILTLLFTSWVVLGRGSSLP
jgi:hypothetical protein